MVFHSKRFRATLLACVLAFAVQPGVAGVAHAEEDVKSEAGMGALAALSSLIYGPLKLVYAAGGLVVGGLAYGLSGGDAQVLEAVITPSVRGDYVVTPSHLRGEDKLEFIGRHPRYRQPVVEEYAVDDAAF